MKERSEMQSKSRQQLHLKIIVCCALALFSCRQPVDEQTLSEIATLDTMWTQVGYRLDSLHEAVFTLDSSLAKPGKFTESTFQSFKSAYDSVTLSFQEFRNRIASGQLGQEDARKSLTGYQNNLADATERLDYLTEE